jgi:hypothetical protein
MFPPIEMMAAGARGLEGPPFDAPSAVETSAAHRRADRAATLLLLVYTYIFNFLLIN